jgi:uncharacterized protein (DUF433 family)
MSEPRVFSDPKVLFGKPALAGTRISVELILEKLGAGDTVEELMSDYRLTREQVLAAVRFAAGSLRQDAVYP